MDVRTGWRRLDAERWVHVWGMAATTLLVLASVWTLFTGWFAGVAFMAVVPGALAALVGGVTSAWRRGRPWAWWVWTIGAAVVGATAANALAAGRAVALAPLAAAGLLLALLFHPDCRVRIGSPPVDAGPPPRW